MPALVPSEAGEAYAGQESGPSPPAHVRVIGGAIDDEDRDYIARKLGMKLGKFVASIERITVRLSIPTDRKAVAIRDVRSKWCSADSRAWW